jgi:hypothetical protein
MISFSVKLKQENKTKNYFLHKTIENQFTCSFIKKAAPESDPSVLPGRLEILVVESIFRPSKLATMS